MCIVLYCEINISIRLNLLSVLIFVCFFDLVSERASSRLCFSVFSKSHEVLLQLSSSGSLSPSSPSSSSSSLSSPSSGSSPSSCPTHLRCFYVSLHVDPAVGFGTEWAEGDVVRNLLVVWNTATVLRYTSSGRSPTPQQLLLDLCNQQQSYVIQLQGALVAFTTPHQLLLDLCNNHSWLLQCASTQPGTSQRKSDRFHNVSSETDLFCTGSIVRQEQLTVYKDCRLSSTAYLVQGYRDYSLVRNRFLCTGTIVHQKQLTLYRDYPIVHQKQLTLYRDYRSSERAYFV